MLHPLTITAGNMEANRADRLADALSLALTAADRRNLLDLSEPEKLIAKAIRCQPGKSVPDVYIPTRGDVAGSRIGVRE